MSIDFPPKGDILNGVQGNLGYTHGHLLIPPARHTKKERGNVFL